MDREVCLFLTLKCNQHCRYCHRFLGIDDLDFNKSKEIINRIASDGIRNMTFTGGEPLIYPHVADLLKLAKEKGIHSKVITNGTILAQNPNMREIYKYLDSITLSIDSANNEVNEELGRGYNHFDNMKVVLESLKDSNIKVNVNTVVSKVNIEHLQELGEFLNDYGIDNWRIFKFEPLRETAKKNKDEFEISSVDFKINKPLFTSFSNIKNVQYREDEDFEDKYVLIMPNGNVVVTEETGDITIGNILKNRVSELLKTRKTIKKHNTFEKIKTLIAYKSESQRDEILNKIKSLNFVEILTTPESEAYNKILEWQPELVVSNYNMSDGINGIDLVEKSKSKLSYAKIPIFNFVNNGLSQEDKDQLLEIGGNKINAFIGEKYLSDEVLDILKEYNEFKQA